MNWYGAIPNRWKQKRIGAVLEQRKEKNDPVKTDFILSLSAAHGVVPYSERKERGGNKPKEQLNKYAIAHNGDLLVNCMNVLSGSSGLSHWYGAISPVYYALYAQNNDVNIEYFTYVFRLPVFYKSLIGLGKGILMHESKTGAWNTIRLRIGMPDLKNVLVPVPDRCEQDQIVRFLDWKMSEINRFIKQKRREIRKLNELKKTIINCAVTKGLDGEVTLKDSGIKWLGKVPEHWEAKRVSPFFSFSKGYSISRADMQTSGLPCIHYGDIHGHCGFEVDPSKQVVGCIDDEKYCFEPDDYLKYGDFLFVGSSEDLEGSGNFTWYNSNVRAIAGTDTIILRTKREINHRFVAYMFDSQSFRNQIRILVNGVKVYHPTQAMIKRAFFVLPPKNEQSEIVDYLDSRCTDIDNMIEALKSEIELITEYRTRMISDVVTGKVDVRDIEVPDIASEDISEDVVEDELLDEEGIADENEEVQEDADD